MKRLLAFVFYALLASASWAQVIQSGPVTPGHLTIWAAPGLVQDGGALIANFSAAGASITSIASGSTYYCSSSGCATSQAIAGIASLPVTLQNLNFNVVTGPAPGNNVVATLMVGSYGSLVATALTCTVSNTLTSCIDAAHQVQINSGQAWAIRIVTSASATATGGESFSMQAASQVLPPPNRPSVLQSGLITSSHLACWTTAGVIQDCGVGNNGVFGPPVSATGNVACWNNTIGNILVDCGKFVPTVPVAQFYVSATGDDANNCQAAAPCLTIARCATVAFSYDWIGGNVQCNVGPNGTFQGSNFVGSPRGLATTSGNSGTFFVLNCEGPSTILTDTMDQGYIVNSSGGMPFFVSGSCTWNIPNGEVAFFTQNNTNTGLTGTHVFNGAGTGASLFHPEGYGIISLFGTTALTLNGTLGSFAALGAVGYVEIENASSNTITCGTLTAFADEFVLADYLSVFSIGTGWSFVNCGSVTGIPYVAVRNSSIINTTGESFPGNAPGQVYTGGRYSPTPAWTLASGTNCTGVGTGGSAGCTLNAIGSHGGSITITAGTSGTAAVGYVILKPGENQLNSADGSLANCSPQVMAGSVNWPSGSTAQLVANTGTAFEISWSANGNDLVTSQSVKLSWTCEGD